MEIINEKRKDRNGWGRYINKYDDLEAFFCPGCKVEARRLRDKYNQRISRMKRIVRFVKFNGGKGRIEQKIEFNERAHIIIKRLKSQVRYYKNKQGDTK